MDNTNDEERPGNVKNGEGCPRGVPETPRPIAVGDYVRWEYGQSRTRQAMPNNWAEGEVVKIDHYTHIRMERVGSEPNRQIGTVQSFGTSDGASVRRIPRPAEAHHGPVPTPPPAPALVDGLTPDECLQRYTLNMQRADDSIPWPLTPLQRCAAQALWAHDLRAKVAASTAADKARSPSVVVERQDEP